MCLGCAAERAEEVEVCCREEALPPPIDFASTVEGPARCAEAARTSDDPWRRLWDCVNQGHFTALSALLSGAWDRDLQTRPDAPLLVLRVIATRGGQVDADLVRLHERRVPLFSLSQALARPALYRGALLIVRARLSSQGVLDEIRLVGRSADVPRWYNLDVPTGQRVLAVVNDPFLDGGDPVVVLARFDGLRDGDGWPELSVLSHLKPAPGLAY
jgi:hypothetical protein